MFQTQKRLETMHAVCWSNHSLVPMSTISLTITPTVSLLICIAKQSALKQD